MAGDEGDRKVGPEHQAILEPPDDEGEDRRDEEEVPGHRAGYPGDKYGAAADAQAQADHGEEVEESHGRVAGVRRGKPARGRQGRQRAEHLGIFARGRRLDLAPAGPWGRALAPSLAGAPVDVDRPADPQEAVDEVAAAQRVEPARPEGLADDDQI